MKSLKYLDALIERKGFKNDRQLALHLGWSSGIMTMYRQGKRVMSEEQCLQIARELGMENPLPIIAAAGIDRAEKTGQKSLWEVFTKATSLSPLAVALMVGVTTIVTPSPVQAAPDLIRPVNESVLC
ncbi:MAG: hypothetical protein C3F19_14925 [Rhodocyclales bacterium]|nr:MAG: hypothetical protein C3F19_14925 [Rhodocyclales bacterium]